jgi:hypothetical protein
VRRWRIELVEDRVDDVLQLAVLFQATQIPEVYSREEMNALTNPRGRECSWAAPEEMLSKPWTFVARSNDDRVIAGVEIVQQKRDSFCFLDLLVRDQAPEYKGAGKEVALEAIGWLMRQTEEGPYGVRCTRWRARSAWSSGGATRSCTCRPTSTTPS